MKVENLLRAEQLREELRIVNVRIDTVENARNVSMNGGNSFDTKSENLKYDGETLLNSIRPLFLSALNRERKDILKEIESLD